MTIPQEIYRQVATFLWKEDFLYTVDDTGMDNIVYVIEDEYILRLSRNKDHNYDSEIQILTIIGAKTTIPIPQILLQDKQWQWFFYKKILWIKTDSDRTEINNMSSDEYKWLLQDLAQFMYTMHNLISDRHIMKIGITCYDKSYNDYIFLKEHHHTITDIKLHTYVAQLLWQYQQYYTNKPIAHLWLIHNDLYGNHFFIDPDSKKLSWIIDFSDTTIADIQLDFTFFYTPDTTLRSDLIDEYCTISQRTIDKEFVLLNMKIFVIKHSINSWKFEDRAIERIENWMQESI